MQLKSDQSFYLVEVGPRDGFQNVKDFIPTPTKLEVIDGLVAAGYKHIQATSFVSPKAIPQMSDAAIVASNILKKYPLVTFSALVPNYKGAVAARESGLKEIATVLSLSESHNMANVRRTVAQSTDEIKRIFLDLSDMKVSVDIATAFGCPFEGLSKLAPLIALVETLAGVGVKVFNLCDTVGLAYPTQIEEFFSELITRFPELVFGAHIHDTRNMGILNSYVALQNGAAFLQSAVGGLGGCPFAPGASGNVASEDLVYMLNQSGYRTGISFEKLLQTAKALKRTVTGNFSGHHIAI